MNQLPCDYLAQVMGFFKRATRNVGSGFLEDDVLNWNKYSCIAGEQKSIKGSKLVKHVLDRTLGIAKVNFSDPSFGQYRLVLFLAFLLWVVEIICISRLNP